MDKEEALGTLEEVLGEYRRMGYDQLVGLIRSPLVIERTGSSGTDYQIEVQAFWDEPRKAEGSLQVLASIDDGRFPHAFMP